MAALTTSWQAVTTFGQIPPGAGLEPSLEVFADMHVAVNFEIWSTGVGDLLLSSARDVGQRAFPCSTENS